MKILGLNPKWFQGIIGTCSKYNLRGEENDFCDNAFGCTVFQQYRI